jgi:hypothetical protein
MRWAVLWILLLGMVLLPFLLFEHQFNAFAEYVTKSGTSRWLVAGAVFALLALDVFLPVPSSIVSTSATRWAHAVRSPRDAWLVKMVSHALRVSSGATGI